MDITKNVIGWCMMIGGSYAMLWFIYKSWRGARSKAWPSVDGRMVSAKIRHRVERGDDGGIEFLPRICYRYEVNGVGYENTEGVHTVAEVWGTKAGAEAVVRQYREKDSVRVFFDPRQPWESVLETGFEGPRVWEYVVMLLIVAAGFLLSEVWKLPLLN